MVLDNVAIGSLHWCGEDDSSGNLAVDVLTRRLFAIVTPPSQSCWSFHAV